VAKIGDFQLASPFSRDAASQCDAAANAGGNATRTETFSGFAKFPFFLFFIARTEDDTRDTRKMAPFSSIF
jgi:hypothetical protein